VRLAAWQSNVWFENQLRQRDRNDGGARRVAAVTRRDRRLKIETSRLAFPSRAQDACDLRGASRQHNTHNIELREVRYAWHPWHDRVVAIHQAFTRSGCTLFRCSIEENLETRLLEIPQWMFDPATCCRMHLAAVPTVAGKALLDLKTLLQGTPLPDNGILLQARHRSLLSSGGADAKVSEPTENYSTQTVSSTPPEPHLAGAASRNPAKNGGVACPTTARTLQKSPLFEQRKGSTR